MRGRMTAVGMVLGALLSGGLPGHAPAQELASLSPSAPIQSAPAIPMFGTHEIHCFNLAPRVVSAAANSDYRAYYSINEAGWWLHLPNPLTPQTLSRQVASR